MIHFCYIARRNAEDIVIRPFPFVTLSFRTLLLLLLAIDFAFIAVNVIAVLSYDASMIDAVPTYLKITEDLQPPEDFNYLKWLVIAVALVWLAVRDRWLAPILWAAVFAMILSDDALQVHERLGSILSDWLSIPDNTLVYGKDLGEILVFGLMGLVTLAVAVFLLSRRDAPSRRMNKRYFIIILALGFCGVGFDAIHAIIQHLTGTSALATLAQQVLGMMEDGGEMLVGSFAVAITLVPPQAAD